MTILRKYFPCEMPHGWPPTANPTRRPKSPRAPSSDAPTGLADGAIGCWHTAEVRPPVDMRGAMAPVYVVTTGSGDTYRIRGFISTAGMAPREPVDVEE
jgi:hypothetical protein